MRLGCVALRLCLDEVDETLTLTRAPPAGTPPTRASSDPLRPRCAPMVDHGVWACEVDPYGRVAAESVVQLSRWDRTEAAPGDRWLPAGLSGSSTAVGSLPLRPHAPPLIWCGTPPQLTLEACCSDDYSSPWRSCSLHWWASLLRRQWLRHDMAQSLPSRQRHRARPAVTGSGL